MTMRISLASLILVAALATQATLAVTSLLMP